MTTEVSLSGCDDSLLLLLSSVLGSSFVVAAAAAIAADFSIGDCFEICVDSAAALPPITELEDAAGDVVDVGGFGCEFIELDVEGVVVVEEDIEELVLHGRVAIPCCDVGGCIGGVPELFGDCCCCCGGKGCLGPGAGMEGCCG